MKASPVFATRSPEFVAQLKSSRRCVRLCFWRGLWVKDTPGNPLAVHKHVSTDTTVFAQACICAEHNFWAHLASAYLTRAWAMGESYTHWGTPSWLTLLSTRWATISSMQKVFAIKQKQMFESPSHQIYKEDFHICITFMGTLPLPFTGAMGPWLDDRLVVSGVNIYLEAGNFVPTVRYWPFFLHILPWMKNMFQSGGVMRGCVKANRGNPPFLQVTSARTLQTVCMQIFEQHHCFLLLMSWLMYGAPVKTFLTWLPIWITLII